MVALRTWPLTVTVRLRLKRGPVSTDLLPSPAFLSSEAMVGRCTTPECQRLADLIDEDITFRVVANMSDGYYPVIGWLCPHCSVFQELFALPAAFQHTIEKIREATYSWHDRSGLDRKSVV